MIPAPVPNRSSSSAIQNVRIATASSASPVSASTQPKAPQYTARGAVSSASIRRRAAILGAPVTEPGGKVAASSSGQPTSSRSTPSTYDTRWNRPGCSCTSSSVGTLTDPAVLTRDRSLRTRSTIMTFSASSFAERSARVRPVPLIGPDRTTRPRGWSEAARKSSGLALAIATPWSGSLRNPP